MAERIVTLDFETYYDKEYSLSKLTTEEYIRSPQFEIILVGVREAYGEVQTFSGTHEEIREWLEQFDLPNAYLLCHNTAFDAAILKWRLGITPKYYLDTLSMSRPLTGNTVGGTLAKLAKQFMLGEKGTEVVNALGKHRHQFSPEELSRYAEYCANDVVLTFNLYNVLLQYTTPREQYLIDLHIRMFVDPVIELDARLLRGHLLSVRQRKEDLLRTVSVTTDELMSNNKFAEVLRGLGVEPPTKLSPRTGKTTFALAKSDMGMKELLNHPDERVQAVAAARLGVKSTLEETRTQAMVYIANRGPLPIMLHYYGAHTGRSSGGDKINPQNLPRGGKLRQAMRAPKGHVFVVADSSQIEARGVAWLAGQDDLVQGFAGGADLYSEFASDIYGRKIDRKREVTLPDGTVTKPDFVEGFVGKTCVAEGTLVLSHRGWKPIESVTTDDLLWDGQEWVCHQGLLNNGIKPTLNLCGAWLTPDHQVWSGTQWLEAQSVVADEGILCRALDTGAESLPSQATLLAPEAESAPSWLRATATKLSTESTSRTSRTSEVLAVRCAPRKHRLRSGIGCIAKHWRTTITGLVYSIASLQRSLVATLRLAKCTSTTAGAAFMCAPSGALTERRFYGTSRLLTAGTTQSLRWTESMWTDITSRATSASYREATTSATNAKLQTSKRVYDVLNSGSRNRFTILTEAGPLIVHNCILGLGYGMGADKLHYTLKVGQGGMAVTLPDGEAERIVKLYRSKYAKLPLLWREAAEALERIVRGYEATVGEGIRLRCTKLGVHLPNGMMIRYPELARGGDGFKPDELSYRSRYGRTRIYGPKLIENVVQALARIVVFNQMAILDQQLRKHDSVQARHKIVLTVHDEVVAVVPKHNAAYWENQFATVMSRAPSWAAGLPIACEVGIAETYGDAK